MFKTKTKQEKYLEIDAVREALGSYINFDAVKDATLLSVTRENINEDNWGRGCEHTEAIFSGPDNTMIKYNLSISRLDHELLITKLTNTK